MKAKHFFIWILLPFIVCLALFHMKHEVGKRKEKLKNIHQEIEKYHEINDVLNAEIAYLKRPERLEALNKKFFHYQIITPEHYISIDHLEKILENKI